MISLQTVFSEERSVVSLDVGDIDDVTELFGACPHDSFALSCLLSHEVTPRIGPSKHLLGDENGCACLERGTPFVHANFDETELQHVTGQVEDLEVTVRQLRVSLEEPQSRWKSQVEIQI